MEAFGGEGLLEPGKSQSGAGRRTLKDTAHNEACTHTVDSASAETVGAVPGTRTQQNECHRNGNAYACATAMPEQQNAAPLECSIFKAYTS